jgi:hypothetical protein
MFGVRPDIYTSDYISGLKYMLGALNDSPPLLIKTKLSSIVFLGEIKIINKILPFASYFVVTLDDNLLIKLT